MKRILLKLGTTTLTDSDGRVDRSFIEDLARQIAAVHRGCAVALVTSGAIRAGMERLGISRKPRQMARLQAMAAVGQGLLMQIYNEAFARHGLVVAQVLLTRKELADRAGYVNAANAFRALFECGAIPIVNENDTVATEEIRLGDNDTLAAMVAALIDADLLLMLSDVDGLHELDAETGSISDRLIPEVEDVTLEVLRHGKDSTTMAGSGGMLTKLQAARIASRCGIPMAIVHGRSPDVLVRYVRGERMGTYFRPQPNGLKGRKRWVAFAPVVEGRIRVNEGAARSLLEGRSSLLPIGIVGCEGEFQSGDLVAVVDPSDREIARGLTSYSAKEIAAIQGVHTSEISGLLGESRTPEVIHKDNLVVGSFDVAEHRLFDLDDSHGA